VGRLPADLGERRSADQRADQRDRRLTGSRGTGTLSAAIGLTVAFTLLVATIQLAARLQRTALTSAAANTAAHLVATEGDAQRPAAEARVRRLLGQAADVRWTTDDAGVRVEIVVPSPTVPGLSADIRRVASARWEEVR
jgi:hypothetical protein